MAVRWITKREKGEVLLPNDTDEKSGKLVIDVLKDKHLDAKIPDWSELEDYDETPNFVDLDITKEVVKRVTRRLSGSAGLGGSDALAFALWGLERVGVA
jgi:hypothetical protein